MTDVVIAAGTRPELIKLAPVTAAIQSALGHERVSVISTGQHDDLLRQTARSLGLGLAANLQLMSPDQTLSSLASGVLREIPAVLSTMGPKLIIVQGDTTTTLMAAIAAFHDQIPIFYVEAGLRSGEISDPFPEEANRRMVSAIAHTQFAPTERARDNLLREGIAANRVHLTGNTSIDALRIALGQLPSDALKHFIESTQGPIGLMTCHRRELSESGMDNWFRAVHTLLKTRPELTIYYPRHPNGRDERAFQEHLAGMINLRPLTPLNYVDMIHLLNASCIAITDSGGLQEEAVALGVPTVVIRAHTERPEAEESGYGILAHPETPDLLELLRTRSEPPRSPSDHIVCTSFGDGHASPRIASVVADFLDQALSR